MFADRAKILIKSGKGGDGHVSFRREKYVPDGGPDGGDGGRGGDVYFVVDLGLNTLIDFKHKRKFAATNGADGGKRNCRGKDGDNIYIKVPKGTVVKDAETGKVIVDMSGNCTSQKILTGGKGGNGNQHYATSTMQAPKYAQPGQPAKELEVILELKMIADVGLVGFPSVGKSSFLSKVSNAKPQIADYHFTTLSPNLGVVDMGDGNSFVVADLPGLIEGAADGQGLGLQFLRHIERNKLLLHVLDAASVEGRDPIEDFYLINEELKKYGEKVSSIPQIIVANKIDAIVKDVEPIDIDEDGELIYPEYISPIERIKAEFEPKGYRVFPISTATGEGIKELISYVFKQLQELKKEDVIFESEYDPDVYLAYSEEPYEVYYDAEEDAYVVEGPRIEKMLGYTNLESEKGFQFFQNFMKDNGILEELENLGIKEGDTVRMYGFAFDYYK
ncbi:MAG: GTPase ObgE [Lachnospiraceae bacterium]|nr:GTPase ObgE [Lachnospiraceae bacterium]MBQ8262516.1 GTPase ObgE [Lachnospiraceae bacterium]